MSQTHSEDTGGESEAHGGSERGRSSQDEVVVNNSAGERLQFGVESSTLGKSSFLILNFLLILNIKQQKVIDKCQ